MNKVHIMKTAKLVNSMNLQQKDKEYKTAKAIFVLNNSNILDYSNLEKILI